MKVVSVICVFILGLCSGCGGGGGGGGGSLAGAPSHGIGSSGGTVQVTDHNSPIYGTEVVVPSGAVNQGQTVNITISYQNQLPGSVQPDVVQASKVIVLTKDAPDDFNQQVTITIPFSDAGMGPDDVPAVFYWDTTYNKYLPLTIINIDKTNKTVAFVTAHFTDIVVLYVPGLVDKILAGSLNSDTGFTPEVDGFFHRNFGSYLDPDGLCYAFASYSIWYFDEKKSIDGSGLYQKYRQADALDTGVSPAVPWEDDTLAREVTARGFRSTWGSNVDGVQRLLSEQVLSSLQTGALLLETMYISNSPQIFLLGYYKTDEHGNYVKDAEGNNVPEYHAVTVYKYDPATGQFYIYDSNFPHQVLTVDWNVANSFTFLNYSYNYGIYFGFGYDSISSWQSPSGFEGLYQKAEHGGWKPSESLFNTIKITSPAPLTAIPPNQDITITGNLTGGDHPAQYVIYYVNEAKIGSTNTDNGAFSFFIPGNLFTQPSNEIEIFATDDPSDEWKSYAGFLEIPNTWAIAAGFNHSLALRSDGTVWAWGDNSSGELGNGTSGGFSAIPVQVPGLTGVSAIAAGDGYSLALKSDGTVWAWGDNAYGELGNGTDSGSTKSGFSAIPVQVPGLTGVSAIAAHFANILALKNDGTVWQWGYFKIDSIYPVDSPVQVPVLTGVRAVAPGLYHSLALMNDGTVWGWGSDWWGELGDQDPDSCGNNYNCSKAIPVQTVDATGVTAIAAGGFSSFGVLSGGSLWAVGGSTLLGDGDIYETYIPVQILTGISSVSAGEHFNSALASDGTVWTWGYPDLCVKGDCNEDHFYKGTPVHLGLTGVSAIAVGGFHTLAVKNDGTVWAWGVNGGYNGSGQLGNGTTEDSYGAVQVLLPGQ